MLEKRNLRLLISLCVLAAITIAFYFFVIRTDTGAVDKSVFRAEDLEVIDRVELISPSEKIELTFNGARWRVNDQPADPGMVDVLFATLQQAEPKRPVAASVSDSVEQLLEQNGVAVKLFEGESLRKEFIAGGNATKTQAYFKDISSEEIYVMVIPGYRVYTSGIFELNENGWKDKFVFNFNWKNFEKLKATFPDNPERDFEIEMGKKYFDVTGLSAVDTTKLNDFLDAISLTAVDQYLEKEDVENPDSVLQSKPHMIILVSDISGKEYQLSIYSTGDQNAVIAIINASQFAYINKQKIKELIRERTWFAKK